MASYGGKLFNSALFFIGKDVGQYSLHIAWTLAFLYRKSRKCCGKKQSVSGGSKTYISTVREHVHL